MEKESLQRMAQIEDEMHLARERSRTDAKFYQLKRQAEANNVLLTPQYLELKKYEALSRNNKIFFGNSIPNMFVNGGCADGKTGSTLIDETVNYKDVNDFEETNLKHSVYADIKTEL